MFPRVVLFVWLVGYCALTLFMSTVLLLMFAEASAVANRKPDEVPLAVVLGVFLVSWPITALVGIVTAALGKTRIAWLVTGIPAGLTLGLLLLASIVGALSS